MPIRFGYPILHEIKYMGPSNEGLVCEEQFYETLNSDGTVPYLFHSTIISITLNGFTNKHIEIKQRKVVL